MSENTHLFITHKYIFIILLMASFTSISMVYMFNARYRPLREGNSIFMSEVEKMLTLLTTTTMITTTKIIMINLLAVREMSRNPSVGVDVITLPFFFSSMFYQYLKYELCMNIINYVFDQTEENLVPARRKTRRK